MKRNIFLVVFMLFIIGFFIACEEQEKEIPPTKSSMEGVWKVSNVTNSTGQDITAQLSYPVVAFHLSSDGTVISSAGPLIMYIVYGQSKYTEIASMIDQVFNYSTLSFNGGEFFIGGGVQSRFTLEMKLEGLPGQKSLTTLLDLLGVGNDYLDVVVYHKFKDVGVSFSKDYQTMTWNLDAITSAVYNRKDNYGNYVLWNGWPVTGFQHCQITLTKQSKDIKDVISAAKKK
ncbi:MAG: hypothetical protein ACOYO1_00165 [Bacteroidales bacterium]